MKKSTAVFLSALLAVTATGCSEDKESSSVPQSSSSTESSELSSSAEETTEPETETATEAETETTETTTQHISPVETVSAKLGIQQSVGEVLVLGDETDNHIKLPLADFIQEGDRVKSFVFVIKSDNDTNIGEFKGGCGISVTSDCDSATDEGWYQSDDFTAPTEGAYGEITWNVPASIADYISPDGEVLFGYWWGNAKDIRVTEVICNIERTAEIPCDGSADKVVNQSVSYTDTDNTIRVSADFLPDDAVPQAVTYNISTSGAFGKFTGGFGYDSSEGYFQSETIAEFTDSSNLSLTWILPDDAKYSAKDGEIVLGYWWSEQPTAKLDSISVKYSIGGGATASKPVTAVHKNNTGFRSSAEIVDDIKVGWNLGNTLESFDVQGKKGLATETAWGNPKAKEELILAVKEAGFNAIRIPVTWGEHMDGDVIQSEWLDRVQEVVNYAYNNDLYVIVNLHHDDGIWFNPTEEEYAGDSAKLKKIWEQISERFKDYGDTLIFEGINEERTIGSEKEWVGGTPEERAVVNKYLQDFVDTVRASGGNNAERTLIVTSYAASAEEVAMNDLKVPDDDNVIVSLHYYAPWKFSDGQETVFSDEGKAELDAKFSAMKKKFIDKGIPLIIDEFGCVAVADDETRAEYYNYYISTAKSYGIKCFVWDNGLAKGDSAYAIINRHSLEWNEAILNGIIDGAE
ncbi:MAG: cellulase family glycosylhydrolase [Ruminococcus flavefaciens]|nr:cellulase family glycosylhydrolase [Ruminococcus flavefaciens]MCM1229170.1 cellulase family glycosylhydrolase [Ruminococcus flavefaciens]